MEKTISDSIKKYVLGTSEKKELEKALSIFEDPYHNLDLRPTLYDLWYDDTLDAVEIPGADFPGMLNEIHHKINLEKNTVNKSKTRKLIFNVSKIAAVLLIGIISGIFVQNFKKEEPVYYTSIAPKGSVSQMILPDNTMVYLNSGSEIKYSISGESGQREVFLTGEAWFQVTKNIEKPFVVHTPYYNVNVLGTEFNVKAYPEDTEITTTLEKGLVQICSTEKFKIQSNQVLTPGEQLIYNKEDNSISLKKVKTQFYTSWKENKLIFINMKLKGLITLLERKYGVNIEVDDPSILELHYDGTLKSETIMEVMEILKHSLPVTYTIQDQKILITKTN
uniref:FecR family protein n=1 Tax=uncultured Draconibacterium sp. TaxID=1573823 RepID=UPI0032179845